MQLARHVGWRYHDGEGLFVGVALGVEISPVEPHVVDFLLDLSGVVHFGKLSHFSSSIFLPAARKKRPEGNPQDALGAVPPEFHARDARDARCPVTGAAVRLTQALALQSGGSGPTFGAASEELSPPAPSLASAARLLLPVSAFYFCYYTHPHAVSQHFSAHRRGPPPKKNFAHPLDKWARLWYVSATVNYSSN